MIPDPGDFYHQPVRLAGAKPVRYVLAEYALDLDEVKRKTTKKTKAVIVNTPSNPTGRVPGPHSAFGALLVRALGLHHPFSHG